MYQKDVPEAMYQEDVQKESYLIPEQDCPNPPRKSTPVQEQAHQPKGGAPSIERRVCIRTGTLFKIGHILFGRICANRKVT
jgi:hypothetical protein